MTRFAWLLFPLLVASSPVACAPATPRGPDSPEVLLGKSAVSFYAERQSIAVAMQDEPIQRLRLAITGGALQLDAVYVTYDDGRRVWIQTRRDLASASSQVIELPNPPSTVRRIDVAYHSDAPPETFATLRLFGS